MIERFLLLTGFDFYLTLGLLSGVLSVVCFIPYIRDTLRGRTKPERASWLIWSVLGTIALFSQSYEGATNSLIFAAAQVGGTLVVFLLSIRFGAGRYSSPRNLFIFAITAFGLLSWYATENAAYALAITISISMLGGIVTIQKCYRAPSSETLHSWALAMVASICALISVGTLDWVLLAYPLYLLALYFGIVVALLLGRWARRPGVVQSVPVFVRTPAQVASSQIQVPPLMAKPFMADIALAPPDGVDMIGDPEVQRHSDLAPDVQEFSAPLSMSPPLLSKKLWFVQSRPMADATSAILHEKPHSLSYQAKTRTVRLPTTFV